MVEALISESEWAPLLRALPQWEPPATSVLVVAPHPDDETLGVGGLIAALCARGVDVRIAAVTDGEHAYPGDSPAQAKALGILREREQTQALIRLGVPPQQISRFRLPDGAVQSSQELLGKLLAALVTSDTHILAPWQGDFHPDHYSCGRAAEQVAHAAGAQLSSYFFWTWHQGSVDRLRNMPLRSFPLTPALSSAKREALLCHQSQLAHAFGEPILPDYLLAPALRPFEVFLVAD